MKPFLAQTLLGLCHDLSLGKAVGFLEVIHSESQAQGVHVALLTVSWLIPVGQDIVHRPLGMFLALMKLIAASNV